MQWVLLGIIAIALILMSSRYPKAAFSLLGLLVAITAFLFYATTDSGFLSRSKLISSNIQIENAIMTPAYADSYRFNARLVNIDEAIALKEVTISITMFDCADETQSSCQVIGQAEERINVEIPPQQARDVARTISFYSASPEAFVRWSYLVTDTRS
ncbi:MAG: hypothetical protein GKR96_10350 [Gammaproteobacteria bacterium]|nr:hypothetical protein [Gammaproteobacteria bacterium]